jgi:hypothetical protein
VPGAAEGFVISASELRSPGKAGPVLSRPRDLADAEATAPAVLRSRADIARFFEGLELVPPGLGDVAAWHAGATPAELGRAIVLGGVGRKP